MKFVINLPNYVGKKKKENDPITLYLNRGWTTTRTEPSASRPACLTDVTGNKPSLTDKIVGQNHYLLPINRKRQKHRKSLYRSPLSSVKTRLEKRPRSFVSHVAVTRTRELVKWIYLTIYIY